jgi:alkaline phosphatase D
VLVVALDLRYFKDPYDQPGGDILGAEQWAWLDATLNGSTARAHVFVSSIQLLVEGRASGGEFWEDFPQSRERFLRLLAAHRVKAPLIVSGDVHFAEVAMADCGESGPGGSSQLVELTTSGLTHAW